MHLFAVTVRIKTSADIYCYLYSEKSFIYITNILVLSIDYLLFIYLYYKNNTSSRFIFGFLCRFSPCICLYLLTIIPPIWILNLDLLHCLKTVKPSGNGTCIGLTGLSGKDDICVSLSGSPLLQYSILHWIYNTLIHSNCSESVH